MNQLAIDLYFEDKAIDPMVFREQVSKLEQAMISAPVEVGTQVQIKTTHRFSKGLYIREVFIPKGTLVVGKIHRSECMSIMSAGDKTMYTEDGYQRVQAPFSCVSRPGIKRVGYAHEDSVWTTIHPNPNDETDIAKIESEIFITDYALADEWRPLFETVTMEGILCQESS